MRRQSLDGLIDIGRRLDRSLEAAPTTSGPWRRCEKCRGDGIDPDDPTVFCPSCEGLQRRPLRERPLSSYDEDLQHMVLTFEVE